MTKIDFPEVRVVYTDGAQHCVWRNRALRFSTGVCDFCGPRGAYSPPGQVLRIVGANGRFFRICKSCLGDLYFAPTQEASVHPAS